MRIKIVRTVFKKEMMDIIRDKKTLFMGIILPLLLYPIMMISMTQIMSITMNNVEKQDINIAFEQKLDTKLMQSIETYKDDNSYDINIVSSSDYKKDLKEGTLHAYIKNENKNDIENYKIYTNSSKEMSQIINSKLENIFSHYNDEKVEDILEQSNLDIEKTLNPITYEMIDVAGQEEMAGSLLGQVLPTILILGVLLGAIYPAIDLMAGEKERGTLETLFTLPISNLELIMGKYMAVSLFAIVTALLNVISMLCTIGYIFVTGNIINEMFSQDFNLLALVGPLTITAICICLFAMIVSAISMCVCSMAKNFKEAQNYITPVMFLVLIPSYASFIPDIVLNRTTAVIPVVNISLLIKSVLSFEFNLSLIALVFVSNFAFVILAVVLLSKIFNSEEILFGNSKSFSFLEKRSDMKKGSMPSKSDGIILFAIGLVSLIYFGSYVQIKFGKVGIGITQLMILALPLLFAYYIKGDFKKIFSLNTPKFKHFIGAISLWIGTYMIVFIITNTILYYFPQNQEVVESLNEILVGDGTLIQNLLFISLMPAICEELFFRGFVLTSFRENKKSYRGAIVACGILFGIMHMDFIRIIPTAILGTSFAYAVCKSGSIYISMFMHFINNAFALVITYIATSSTIQPSTEVSLLSIPQLLILISISALFIIIGVYLFSNKKSSENIKSNNV